MIPWTLMFRQDFISQLSDLSCCFPLVHIEVYLVKTFIIFRSVMFPILAFRSWGLCRSVLCFIARCGFETGHVHSERLPALERFILNGSWSFFWAINEDFHMDFTSGTYDLKILFALALLFPFFIYASSYLFFGNRIYAGSVSACCGEKNPQIIVVDQSILGCEDNGSTSLLLFSLVIFQKALFLAKFKKVFGWNYV